MVVYISFLYTLVTLLESYLLCRLSRMHELEEGEFCEYNKR